MLRFMGKTGINSSFFMLSFRMFWIFRIFRNFWNLWNPRHIRNLWKPLNLRNIRNPPDQISSRQVLIIKKNRKPLHTPLGAGTDEGIRALYFRLVLPIQVRVCQGFLLMGYVMALIPLSCVGAHVYVLVASYCAISFSCSSARAISAFSLSTRRFISSMRESPCCEETERKQILFS